MKQQNINEASYIVEGNAFKGNYNDGDKRQSTSFERTRKRKAQKLTAMRRRLRSDCIRIISSKVAEL